MNETATNGESNGDASEPPEVFSRSSRALLWRESRADIHAARAVLAHPCCEVRSAAVHLLRAWDKLARVYAEAAEASPPERDQLPSWVRDAPLDGWDEAGRSAAADTVTRLLAIEHCQPWQEALETPSRDALGAHATTIEKVLADADASLLEGSERKRARRRWVVRGAVLLAVTMAAGGYLALAGEAPSGPWRAEYYGKRFKGKPVVHRAADVDFDWGTGPPIDQLGIDRWSGRWHTCLVLDTDESITFELSSADGSRLYIDGDQAVDNSGVHALQSEVGTVELDAGAHHLRVDYYNHQGEASVRLRAAFEGGLPGPIPTGMLLYPGADLSQENPCAATDAEDGEE